jgi:hypothetical protein
MFPEEEILQISHFRGWMTSHVVGKLTVWMFLKSRDDNFEYLNTYQQ